MMPGIAPHFIHDLYPGITLFFYSVYNFLHQNSSRKANMLKVLTHPELLL